MFEFNHSIERNKVFRMLDKIEDKALIMAHEIPELKDNLRLWQDNKLDSLEFFNELELYYSKMKRQITK